MSPPVQSVCTTHLGKKHCSGDSKKDKRKCITNFIDGFPMTVLHLPFELIIEADAALDERDSSPLKKPE